MTASGANMHFSNRETPTMEPVKCEHTMEEKLPDGITTESTHVATLLITGLSKESRKINILPETKASPLISLGVL